MIQQIRISSLKKNPQSSDLLYEIHHTLGITSVTNVDIVKVYSFEGLEQKEVRMLADNLLIDPLTQTVETSETTTKKIEVARKPGVMNPEVGSLFKAAQDLRISQLQAADVSYEYHFYGTVSDQELDTITRRLLMNETVDQVVVKRADTLQVQGSSGPVETIALRTLSDDQLQTLSKDRQLYLTLPEMQEIQNYFIQLDRDPYDAELETLAQTWSEHCCHKTFKADVLLDGQKKSPLFSLLKDTAKDHFETKKRNVLSAFHDNAGVFEFYDDYAIAIKAETHNSPSAIEPYGGAATGTGGVFRDIMGTGKGAKVIASTNMFCLAPPHLPSAELPDGCLHPQYLLRKVVAGVRDYGNRMGVPTNNGSFHFHNSFKARPTVIVGAYGILPVDKAQKGTPQADDLIVAVGGATGRDGIHGATFSSDSMTGQTQSTHASAVQIGNAIEEKRMSDALLACRDAELIRAITDCGAGGFSSAIGEMAEHTGARVDLEKAPTKYSGLAPWELWISESQERMVCAVAPDNLQNFLTICAAYNTNATVIGLFTNTKHLEVFYDSKHVVNLSMNFLHNGVPRITKVGTYRNKPTYDTNLTTTDDIAAMYKKVMGHLNVCSKEPVVRQYDHTVQGTNVQGPFGGKTQSGPNNAAVLTPLLGKPYGLIISHGLNPVLNSIDPYTGTLWAVNEALANYVAVGGSVHEAVLVDNFIWPKPDEESMADLYESVDACKDAMNTFGIPFISGKDSLSSTYVYNDGTTLKIDPVICISVCGKVPDVAKTVTSSFKKVGSAIVLLGNPDWTNMAGSVYAQITNYKGANVPQPKGLPKLFDQVHALIQEDVLRACHDISEGGLAAAVAEMGFGNMIGAELSLSHFAQDGFKGNLEHLLFNESSGCFVAEIDEAFIASGRLKGIPHHILGKTVEAQTVTLSYSKTTMQVTLDELKEAWQKPMQEVFHS